MREIVARPAGAGAFEVEATAGGRRHAWRVSVPGELAARHGSEPEDVARATIAFLLDREPPGSIMATFDCSVVPRYFRLFCSIRGWVDLAFHDCTPPHR